MLELEGSLETIALHGSGTKIKVSRKRSRSSRVAQLVKEPALSLQWFGSLLWHGCSRGREEEVKFFKKKKKKEVKYIILRT